MVGKNRMLLFKASATFVILPLRTPFFHTVNCFQSRNRRKNGIDRKIALKISNSCSKRAKVENAASPCVTTVTPFKLSVQWSLGSTSVGPAAMETWYMAVAVGFFLSSRKPPASRFATCVGVRRSDCTKVSPSSGGGMAVVGRSTPALAVAADAGGGGASSTEAGDGARVPPSSAKHASRSSLSLNPPEPSLRAPGEVWPLLTSVALKGEVTGKRSAFTVSPSSKPPPLKPPPLLGPRPPPPPID